MDVYWIDIVTGYYIRIYRCYTCPCEFDLYYVFLLQPSIVFHGFFLGGGVIESFAVAKHNKLMSQLLIDMKPKYLLILHDQFVSDPHWDFAYILLEIVEYI